MAIRAQEGRWLEVEPITAAANLAKDSFVNADGSVPASAAAGYGVLANNDCANGDTGDVVVMGVKVVVATGTCTKGTMCEILQGTTTTKDGTNVTFAGVQNKAVGVAVGKLLSSGAAGDTVRVALSAIN